MIWLFPHERVIEAGGESVSHIFKYRQPFYLTNNMQISVAVPKFPSVSELANAAAHPPAPRLSKRSSSFVSLLERAFGVDNSGSEILPTAEEIAEIEAGITPYPTINPSVYLEREMEFRAIVRRPINNSVDGIVTGALIGTGLTFATALGGAPITAAVLLASVAEFTAFAGSPSNRSFRAPKRSLSDIELKETTVVY